VSKAVAMCEENLTASTPEKGGSIGENRKRLVKKRRKKRDHQKGGGTWTPHGPCGRAKKKPKMEATETGPRTINKGFGVKETKQGGKGTQQHRGDTAKKPFCDANRCPAGRTSLLQDSDIDGGSPRSSRGSLVGSKEIGGGLLKDEKEKNEHWGCAARPKRKAAN